MSDTLLILLPPLGAAERPANTQDMMVSVALLNERGSVSGRVEQKTLAEAGRQFDEAEPGERECVALLAGEDVLLNSVALPGQKQRQLRQALPFLVEEFVADDPEDIHVVLGPLQDDGTHAVAIVRRDLLRFWLEALAKEDIYPEQVIPEQLFIPVEENTVGSLVVDAGRCFLRTGPYTAMTLERETLRDSLRICLRAATDQRAVA